MTPETQKKLKEIRTSLDFARTVSQDGKLKLWANDVDFLLSLLDSDFIEKDEIIESLKCSGLDHKMSEGFTYDEGNN